MRRLQNAWIFVSHSTLDITEVRRIRNEVELQGGEPLLFFLKSISDNDELDGLLKREIEARRYFLLCDSPAASASKWVQEEVAHVTSLRGKRFETLDLADLWQNQVDVIQRLLRKATLFPCYAMADKKIVDPLLASLKSQEFSLFDAFDRPGPAEDLAQVINQAIDDSGCLLDFLSRASIESRWCRIEAQYFLEKTDAFLRYIPVILEPDLLLHQVQGARERVASSYIDRDVDDFAQRLEAVLYA